MGRFGVAGRRRSRYLLCQVQAGMGMAGWFRAGALALLALIGACSQLSAPRPRSVDAQPGAASALSQAEGRDSAALYREAAHALGRGERALLGLRQGGGPPAGDALTRTRTRFRQLLARCAVTPGCELNRILSQQERLLAQQTRIMLSADEDGAAPVADDDADITLAQVPESARSANLLNGRQLGQLIEMNEPLRAALREWLTWMRPNLLDAYEYYQYMRYKMWPEYAKAGLPEALLFGIIAKESGGKVHAVSPSGAAGPLQFMPATGRRFGLGVERGFDTRFDPASATAANVAYLNEQLGRLNNDLELVLGAYNGGEGRMGRLSPRGSRKFWDPRVFRSLSPETREYVPMVLAAAWLYLHPERHGLRLPRIDPEPGVIKLAHRLSLNELAICLGQEGNPRGWFRILRNLNPRWDSNERLAVGTKLEAPRRAADAYAQACTDGKTVARLAAMQDARIPGFERRGVVATAVRTHVVARGETLSTIARKLGCNGVKHLASANGIAAPRYSIRAGQRLRVPDCRA